MSSNPTNPEQVCAWCNGTGVMNFDASSDCPHCHGTGKVAAGSNETAQPVDIASSDVNAPWNNEVPNSKAEPEVGTAAAKPPVFTGNEAIDAIIYANAETVHNAAPAPVDQPDELEQRLHKVFDDIYRYGGTGKAGARMVMGIYEPIIAREREASYAEGWRHGKFLEKNRHILHLRYMLDGYPSDAPEYTYVKSLFEREIAALTKGEETSQ